jgi:hypothetical protein
MADLEDLSQQARACGYYGQAAGAVEALQQRKDLVIVTSQALLSDNEMFKKR